MNPERPVQPKFSIRAACAGLALVAAVALFDRWLASFPNRVELGWREASIAFRPVRLGSGDLGPLRLVGAWQVTSSDPRFGGISALAIDRGRLLALTDSGVLAWFSPPGGGSSSARIGELPGGPGRSGFKRNRDSEALARDPDGRGWWVAFENHHQLWLYDPQFARPLQRTDLRGDRWRANRGVEGAATDGGALLLFHEAGDRLLRLAGNRVRSMGIAGARGRASDAAALGEGQWIVVERRLTPAGFRNALVILDRAGSGYRFGARITLPLGALDNVEAMAIERQADGWRRLWLMTDDNFQPPMRTLLVAFDLPAGGTAPSR